MKLPRAIARIPTALFFAATAWSPIEPFRPKPLEVPCIVDVGFIPQPHALVGTCFVDGDPPRPITRAADVAEQPKVV